jgi:uncharacterized protein
MKLNREFVDKIIKQFPLNVNGTHGIGHWQRVLVNGLKLARTTGADTSVVIWFAYLHDCRRLSEGGDNGHGPRAAVYARTHKDELGLNETQLKLLLEAISCHTKGCGFGADITVQTCLDADRLDIKRIGARVDPNQLYTEVAREIARKENESGQDRKSKDR